MRNLAVFAEQICSRKDLIFCSYLKLKFFFAMFILDSLLLVALIGVSYCFPNWQPFAYYTFLYSAVMTTV
jgi:hypothetical protein